MICHLTIGPSCVARSEETYSTEAEAKAAKWYYEMTPTPRDCIGSRCSAWCPTSSGMGFCALVIEPSQMLLCPTWPDPAAEKGEEVKP